jgi:hypothetical protein
MTTLSPTITADHPAPKSGPSPESQPDNHVSDRPAVFAKLKPHRHRHASHRHRPPPETVNWMQKARMLSFGLVVLTIFVIGCALLIIGFSELFDDGGSSLLR